MPRYTSLPTTLLRIVETKFQAMRFWLISLLSNFSHQKPFHKLCKGYFYKLCTICSITSCRESCPNYWPRQMKCSYNLQCNSESLKVYHDIFGLTRSFSLHSCLPMTFLYYRSWILSLKVMSSITYVSAKCKSHCHFESSSPGDSSYVWTMHSTNSKVELSDGNNWALDHVDNVQFFLFIYRFLWFFILQERIQPRTLKLQDTFAIY